jgi:hypothetical protein
MKSQAPPVQAGEPCSGAPHTLQLAPQALPSSSWTQRPPQSWNPAAQGNTHLLATHAGSLPGGAFALQSMQTFTPQSSGVFVQGPSTRICGEDIFSSGDALSFEPLPQPADASTAANAMRFTREDSRIRSSPRS